MLDPDGDARVFVASVVIAWAVVAASVVLLFVKAVATSAAGIFFYDADARARKRAAYGTMAGGLDLVSEWMGSAINVVSAGFFYFTSISLYFVTLMVLAGALHVLYLYFPVSLGQMTLRYNEVVGPWWDQYVLNLLETLQTVFETSVGMYNILVFVLVKLPVNLMLHMLSGGVPDLVKFGEQFGLFAKELYVSTETYFTTQLQTCGRPEDRDCFNPANRDMDLVTPLLHMNKAAFHLIDFVPRQCTILTHPIAIIFYPLTDIETSRAIHHFVNAALHLVFQLPLLTRERYESVEWFEDRRLPMAFPDLAPVFDHLAMGMLRLGKTLDNWLDVTYYMAHRLIDPSAAVECDLRKGATPLDTSSFASTFGPNRTIMVPLVEGLYAVTDGTDVEWHHYGKRSHVRIGVDVWPIPIDVTYGVAAVAFARDLSRDEAVAGHTTAMFGCGCRDDAEFGIQVQCAVVPYVAFDGRVPGDFVVNVTWEIANTPRRMACRDTKISVQSIRYQLQRLTTPSVFADIFAPNPPTQCATNNRCTRVDAAVWIMPVCTVQPTTAQSAGLNTACVRDLKDFSCFPYCLGIRRSFSANERIFIRSSTAWERNVVLASRDCAFQRASEDEQVSTLNTLNDAEDVTSTFIPKNPVTDVENLRVTLQTGDRGKCVHQPRAVSSSPSQTIERDESASFFARQHRYAALPDYAQDNAEDLYRFSLDSVAMLSERQPIIFAGDAVLTTVTHCLARTQVVQWEGAAYQPRDACTLSENPNCAAATQPQSDQGKQCTTVLAVQRLSGNEQNQFSLWQVAPVGMAVAPRPQTINQTSIYMKAGSITLPPVVVRSVRLHNPATATRDAVFYATNPDYEMLHCAIRYCGGYKDLVNCLQFSVLTNYERLRFWKLLPQAGCEMDKQTGRVSCPQHAARSVELIDEYSMEYMSAENFDIAAFCDPGKDRNWFVQNMDAMDSMNIVVTVRRGNMAGLQRELWGDIGTSDVTPRASTVFYFLNPETMEMRENIPWAPERTVARGAGYICDEMRSMPRLGSAFAEAQAAFIFFMKKVVGLLLAIPALDELYDDPDERCALEAVSMHHSAYDDCGTGYLDLTEAFDSINRANAHVWEVFDTLSLVFTSRLQLETSAPIATRLAGARMYQENQVSLQLTGILDDFIEMADANAEKFAFGEPSGERSGFGVTMFSMGSPAFMSGMGISITPVAYAEYMWTLFSRSLDRTIVLGRRAERRGDPAGLAAKYVIGNITNIWYDSLAVEWQDIVVNRGRRMCTGISMMLGYSNAWGRFMRHWCLAGLEYTNGVTHAMASFSVDVQVTACVCAESVDHDFESFVREVCVPRAPDSMQIFLLTMLAWHGDIKEEQSLDRLSLMQTVCMQTLEEFHDALHNAFTPWAEEQMKAAKATISMLDYVGVLMGRDSRQCESMQTNPLVAIVLPTPIDYFRVCGRTSVCRLKCAAYQAALDEALASDAGNAVLDPLNFRTNMENNMFKRYRPGEIDEASIHLLYISELPPTHFDCTCGENTDCVGIVGGGYGSIDAERLYFRTYCVPAGVGERVYMGTEWLLTQESTGLRMKELLDEDENDSILRIAFSTPVSDHILLHLRTFTSILDEGESGPLSSETDWVVAIRHSSVLPSATIVNSQSIRIECRETLAAALREGPFNEQDGLQRNFELSVVKIHDFVSLNSSEYTVDLVAYLDIRGTVTVSSSDGAVRVSRDRFVAQVTLRIGWCEYIPANFDGPRRATPSRCVGLWENRMQCSSVPVEMQQTFFVQWLSRGSLFYDPVPDQYLWIPSSNVAEHHSVASNILHVNISLSDGVFHVDTDFIEFPLGGGGVTRQALGPPYLRVVGDRVNRLTHTPHPNSPVGHYRADDDPGDEILPLGKVMWFTAVTRAVTRAWMREARYNYEYRTMSTSASRQKVVNVSVVRYCNSATCTGCRSLQTMQLCTALQTCMTQECIGSRVNYGDVVCNIGHILESGMGTTISVYIAGWHAIVSIVTEVLQTTAFEQTGEYKLRIEWISDLVYTMVCEMKDTSAALAGMVTAMMFGGNLPGLDREVSPASTISYGLQRTSQVNSESTADGMLLAAAFHQMWYQFALFPMYITLGTFRWSVCTFNDFMTMDPEGRVSISLGDLSQPGINVQTISPCTTQYAVEQVQLATRKPVSEELITMLTQDSLNNNDDFIGETIDTTTAGVAGALGLEQASIYGYAFGRTVNNLGEELGVDQTFSVQSETVTTADGRTVANAEASRKFGDVPGDRPDDVFSGDADTGGSDDARSSNKGSRSRLRTAAGDLASGAGTVLTGTVRGVVTGVRVSSQFIANGAVEIYRGTALTTASNAAKQAAASGYNAATGTARAAGRIVSNAAVSGAKSVYGAANYAVKNPVKLFNGIVRGGAKTYKRAGDLQWFMLKKHLSVGTVLAVWKHVIDAGLAWTTGILTGLQDILYNLGDPACQISKINLADTVECACNDEEAFIVDARRREGIEQGAFWCSGMLFLPLDSGRFGYVYNPFSLHEMGVCMSNNANESCANPDADMRQYLQCLSRPGQLNDTECAQYEPVIQHFKASGVSAMSVLARCRSNYAQKVWDIGAHALFDPNVFVDVDFTGREKSVARERALLWADQTGSRDLVDCLLTTTVPSEFSSNCLDIFLRDTESQSDLQAKTIGTRRESYFAYKLGFDNEVPNTPDACSLFTGPARHAGSNGTRARFSACLMDTDVEFADVECSVPMMAWSGDLHNRVPMATVHREQTLSLEKREAIAGNLYAAARARIESAFATYEQGPQTDAIDVLFFTAEGDALHQMIDCMFLGPYSKVDYLVTDAERKLVGLEWYRDNATGTTRNFDLPCTDEKLQGDNDGPPYTCGSPARRAVIKYYVREKALNQSSAAEVTKQLVADQLASIKRAWLNESNYGCSGPDGSVSYRNCGDPLLSGGVGYTPALPDFTSVPSETLLEKIVEGLNTFYGEAMTDSLVWSLYFRDDVQTELWGMWDDAELAAHNQLFAPHEPIVSYNESEVLRIEPDAKQFSNSLWGVCTSLLSQAMVTMPLLKTHDDMNEGAEEDRVPLWAPRFVYEEALGPYRQVSRTEAEEFERMRWMDDLLQESWEKSPLYLHYTMRYVPSDSMVCEDKHATSATRDTSSTFGYMDVADPVIDDETLLRMDGDDQLLSIPFAEMAIGMLEDRCPCGTQIFGTESVSTIQCEMSTDACAKIESNLRLFEDSGDTHLLEICNGDRRYPTSSHPLVSVIAELWYFGAGAPCSLFELGTTHGFMGYREETREGGDAWNTGTVDNEQEVRVDGMDLLAVRRAGITPANLAHVIRSMRNGSVASHAGRRMPLADAYGNKISQAQCIGSHRERRAKEGADDNTHAKTGEIVDEFFDKHFPVAQLIYESPAVSSCTRFLLEFAKHRFLEKVMLATGEAPTTQKASMVRWRERCSVKLRQMSSCVSLGVYNHVPPRTLWESVLRKDCATVIAGAQFLDDDEDAGTTVYVTSGCLLRRARSGDRVDWYDLHACWYVREPPSASVLRPEHLVDRCKLHKISDTEGTGSHLVNPLEIVHGLGAGALHWGEGGRFAGTDGERVYKQIEAREALINESALKLFPRKTFAAALLGMSDISDNIGNIVLGNAVPDRTATTEADANSLQQTSQCKNAMMCEANMYCDKIFDWWPDNWQNPVGYHPTGVCMREDHAYRTFMNHYATDVAKDGTPDADGRKFVYHHTWLRDAGLFYNWLGTGGLCRLGTIGMPLLQTNTHRVCTMEAKESPNPAMPISQQHARDNAKFGSDETSWACSDSSTDVPWDAHGRSSHPSMLSVGTIADFFWATARDSAANVGRRSRKGRYPAFSLLGESATTAKRISRSLPGAGVYVNGSANTPWSTCAPPATPVSCDASDADSCPLDMVCVVEEGMQQGICFPKASTGRGRRCYRSDMCSESHFCTAEGYCQRVSMHLWNTGTSAIEYTVLNKDVCGRGFQTSSSKTQTFAGASPWETVPHVLQGHGMCAARHQYSYHFAMKHRIEDNILSKGKRGLLTPSQNTGAYDWPWIQQEPGGALFDEDEDTASPNFMHVHPHPCDRTYMHMRDFKVCSGTNGDRTVRSTPYKLDEVGVPSTEPIWRLARWRATPRAVQSTNAYWMRTTLSGAVRTVSVATVFRGGDFDEESRGAFSFLGGNANNSDLSSYEGAVGNSKARFFRCVTGKLCGVPDYTFHGVTVPRLKSGPNDEPPYLPLTPDDVELCGSIGYRVDIGSDLRAHECLFDLRLFPHIRLMVAGTSTPCMLLFGNPSGDESSGDVEKVGVISVVRDFGAECRQLVLCCLDSRDEDSVKCKYLGIDIANVGLSNRNSRGGFTQLVQKLNAIHTLGTMGGYMYAPERTAGDRLRIITECVEQMYKVNVRNQGVLITQYSDRPNATSANLANQTTSGLYHVMVFHLYEMPWLWYYKWLYDMVVLREPSGVLILGQAPLWDTGSVQIGEGWQSRTSVEQQSVRSCGTRSCTCSSDTRTARGELACLNAGLPLVRRDFDGGSVATADISVDKFVDALRIKIKQVVWAHLLQEFGINPDEPGSYVSGCYLEARWNRETCLADDRCAEFLVRNVSGEACEKSGECMNVDDPANYEFFLFEEPAYQRGVGNVNLRYIVEHLIDNYAFVDPDLDELSEPLLHINKGGGCDSGEAGECDWAIPILKLLPEPMFPEDTEYQLDELPADVTATDHSGFGVDDTQCIFPDRFDERESATYDYTFGAHVSFYTDEAGGQGIGTFVQEIDICNTNSLAGDEHDEIELLDGSKQRQKRMSCSFRQDIHHGVDYCDWDLSGMEHKCWNAKPGTCLAVLFGSDTGTEHFCMEADPACAMWRAKVGNTLRDEYPYMICVPEGTPLYTDRCVDSGETPRRGTGGGHVWTYNAISGRGAEAEDGNTAIPPSFRYGAKYTYFSRDDPQGRPLETDRVDPANRKNPSSFGHTLHSTRSVPYVGHYVNEGVVVFDDSEMDIATGQTVCPTSIYDECREARAYLGLPADMRTRDVAVECGRHYFGDESLPPIPQDHPKRNMCHNINGNCFQNRDDWVRDGECQLRYASLPPGVAGRFFASEEQDPANWPYNRDKKRSWVFQQCPNRKGHNVTVDGLSIPFNNKSDPRLYAQYGEQKNWAEDTIVSCTAQQQGVQGTFGRCLEEDGCWVVDGNENSEWYMSKAANPACANKQGACFFELALADGFHCGEATEHAGSFIPPQNVECAHRDVDSEPGWPEHAFLVRGFGSFRGQQLRRGLWRCAPCLRYHEIQYRGLMRCGFRSTEVGDDGQAATFTAREVLARVKQLLSNKTQDGAEGGLFTLARLKSLQTDGENGGIEFAGTTGEEPYVPPGGGDIAYLRLRDLPFAADFDNWGGDQADGCSQTVTDAQTEDTARCAFANEYDALDHYHADLLYQEKESDALRCQDETPPLAEYKECSDASNVKRDMLRDWVNDYWRRDQGTWLPVLPARSGVQWSLDRNAASRAFTVFFAATSRQLQQRHVARVLGNSVCASNSRKEGICAVTRDKVVYVVNPWIGGEFSIGVGEESEEDAFQDGMGLDQCQRADGTWEICCSCFPVSRCCYPDGEAKCNTVELDDNVRRIDTNFFKAPAHDSYCRASDFDTPVQPPRPESFEPNICARDARGRHSESCLHHQGVVGGEGGGAIGSVERLYHTVFAAASATYDVEDFLTAAHPTLWAGGLTSLAVDYVPGKQRVLRMPPSVLYPAHIVLAVGGGGSVLRVQSFQMQHGGGQLYDSGLHTIGNWFPTIASTMASEFETVVKRLYPHLSQGGTATARWDCPLRRVAFWGKNVSGFNPLMPDPLRSDYMFRGVYQCKDGGVGGTCVTGIHPYIAPREFTRVADFVTTDGACFYVDAPSEDTLLEAGLDQHDTDDTPCSIRSQLRRIVSGTATESYVRLSPHETCEELIDWPAQAMPFRNGEQDERADEQTDREPCGLLPRVTPFKIKYVAHAPITMHPTLSTLDAGGDCNMGRAHVIDDAKAQELRDFEHCIIVARTVTQATIRCSGSNRGASEVVLQPQDKLFEILREERLHPHDDIVLGQTGKQRARCDECNVEGIGKQGPEAAGGEESLPETSTGVPVRYSAARTLAQHLKRECDATEDCKINPSAWNVENFAKTFFETPWNLLATPRPSKTAKDKNRAMKAAIQEIEDEVDDRSLWAAVPWVLSSGQEGASALGTIGKTAWHSARYDTCWGVIGEAIKNDTTGLYVRNLEICDMTGPLADLCQELFEARGDIENANCIASGQDCEILATFYSPSQWSATNQAFARETIRDFYLNENSDACADEPRRIRAAEEEVAAVLPQCPASSMDTVKEAVQYLRLTIYVIISVVEAVGQIFLNLIVIFVRAVQGLPIGDAVADLMYQFMRIVGMMFITLEQLLNMLIHFFSELHSAGKVIAQAFYAMCKAVSILYTIVVDVLMCTVFAFVLGVLKVVDGFPGVNIGGAITAVEDMLNAVDCSPYVFGNVGDAVTGGVVTNWNNFCEWPADMENGYNYSQASIPTRCWANPAFGDLFSDTNLLGCTVADTCLLDNAYDFDSGNETVRGNMGVCERCPEVDVENFMRFGCDMSIRKCKCGVPIQTVTPCLRNSDCYQNAPCLLKASVDSQSYSSVDCLSVAGNDPVCLVDSITGAGDVVNAGTCVQLLKAPTLSACEERDSVVPLYKNTGVCMYAQDRFTAESLSVYASATMQVGSLAVVPCAFLSAVRGHATCQNVQARSGRVQRLIVGSQLVGFPDLSGFARRLLWDAPMSDTATLWMPVAESMMLDTTQDWKGTGVCEDLVLAARHGEGLGVLDRATVKGCYKWRAVANVSARMFDLWQVSDTVFLHWTNAANMLLDQANAASSGVNRSMFWRPDAYAEAALYSIMQVENTEKITSFLRHAYQAARRALDVLRLAWLRAMDRAQTSPAGHNSSGGTTPRPAETSAPFVHWSNGTHFTGLRIPDPDSGSFYSNYLESAWYTAASKETGPPPAGKNGTARRNITHTSRFRRNRQLLQDIDGLQGGWPVVWSDVIWRFRSENSRTCDLFDIANESIRHLVNSSQEYFDSGYRDRNHTNYSLSATLMKGATVTDAKAAADRARVLESREGVLNSTIFSVFLDSIVTTAETLSCIEVENVIGFFNPDESLQQQIDDDLFTMPRIMHDMTHCNVKRLMLCDTQPRGLVPTIIICGFIVWILAQGLWLSSGTTAILMVWLLPWFVMWYSYGYSPSCFPMIPTCLMHDLKVALDSTFPSHIQWPALLIHQDVCYREGIAIDPAKRNTTNCFKSCAGDEFQFRSWVDPFAWFLCEAHVPTCERVGDWFAQQTSLGDGYNASTEYFVQVLLYDNPHYTVAHRTCAFLTGFYIIPAFLFALWLLLMSTTLVRTVIVLTLKTIVFAMRASADAEEPIVEDAEDTEASGDADDPETPPRA